ncbi:MAG: isoprenylcysteine carboxylmethyltransferase family protein [Acidobacteria bacterium]|nr:MAG: isoprenylcysteine carboxylmethyltransferase family protein [Acidobacteriota bacterium]
MMETSVILKLMWSAMGIYWLVAVRIGRKTEVSESSWFRVLRLGILAVTFILLLSPWLRVGWLERRLLPDTAMGRIAGVALTTAGLLLCIWARRALGEYWSDKVVLKVDHQLIRRGPYAHLRHPIYSGVLLAVAGTALAIGEWRCLVALALLGTNYFVKAKREDRLLAMHFGDDFAEYKRQAGFLAPKL